MQPSDPTLLGRFLLLRSKRHLRCCSKLLVYIFYFFGHQHSTTTAFSITLWVCLPIIWSTNVRQTWTRGWKFCTSLCSHLPYRLMLELKRLKKKQLLAGIAIIVGIPFPVWIYYNGEGLRARNPLTKMSTIPKRIS